MVSWAWSPEQCHRTYLGFLYGVKNSEISIINRYVFESTDAVPGVCRISVSEEYSSALKINSKEKKTLGLIESFPAFFAQTPPAGKPLCRQRMGCQTTEGGERKVFGSSDLTQYTGCSLGSQRSGHLPSAIPTPAPLCAQGRLCSPFPSLAPWSSLEPCRNVASAPAVLGFLLQEDECQSWFLHQESLTHTCTVHWTLLTSPLSSLLPLCARKHPQCPQEEPVHWQQISWGGNLMSSGCGWMSLPTPGYPPCSHLSVLWPGARAASRFSCKILIKGRTFPCISLVWQSSGKLLIFLCHILQRD